MIEDIELELTLSVNEWNVVIGALNVLAFAEAKEIIDTIAEQSKDSKAVGEETVTIKMVASKSNQVLGVLQLLPYHVANQVIAKVYNQAMEKIREETKEAAKEEAKTE